MTGHANCPACGQQMEMNFTVAEVQTTPLPELPETCTEVFGDCEISFRLPNSSDLATLVPGDDLAIQKRRLVQRCVLNAKRSGQLVAADQLPEDAGDGLVRTDVGTRPPGRRPNRVKLPPLRPSLGRAARHRRRLSGAKFMLGRSDCFTTFMPRPRPTAGARRTFSR